MSDPKEKYPCISDTLKRARNPKVNNEIHQGMSR